MRARATRVCGLACRSPAGSRPAAAEQALAGANAADVTAAAARAAEAAVAGLEPVGDLHASPQTRLALARTYLRRGIELATFRAMNER